MARFPLQHAFDTATRAFAVPSNAPTPLLPPTSSNSPSSFELEAMKSRIVELEEKLSQVTSNAASVYSVTASSPALTHNVQTITSFAGTIDVLQDSRAFGRTHPISRSVAHKNRVFGQSHWMNGFIVVGYRHHLSTCSYADPNAVSRYCRDYRAQSAGRII